MEGEKIDFRTRIRRKNIFKYRLRQAMFAKHISSKKIWETTDITKHTMQAYVRGRIPESWESCVTLADALGVSTDFLFGEDIMKKKEPFGKYLEKEIKKRGLTAEEFAEVAGVSKYAVKEWIKGVTPKTGMFKKIAKALDCTEEELLQKFTCTPKELMGSKNKI